MSEYTTDHDLQFYEKMSCGYNCRMTKKYGFVPEAGCPVHDKIECSMSPDCKCEDCIKETENFMRVNN